MGKIVVIGSSNTDLVVKTPHIPLAGETVIGGGFMITLGGKGANQAIAVKRTGGNVIFITKIGDDMFGSNMREALCRDGLPAEFILSDSVTPTGVAMISVDDKGENCIVVAPGANYSLTKADIDASRREIEQADFLLMQLEIPMDVVRYATDIAAEAGTKVILNPAPAAELDDTLLAKLFLITPNEIECRALSCCNDSSVAVAAECLRRKGVANVVVTLGSRGSLIKTADCETIVPALNVEAVDTTGAGDTYNGALTACLAEGKPLIEAVEFATAASAIAVTRMGAQPSIPYRDEIEKMIARKHNR